MKTVEHCQEKTCVWHREGDNCWYWKHRRNGLCTASGEVAKLLSPLYVEPKEGGWNHRSGK